MRLSAATSSAANEIGTSRWSRCVLLRRRRGPVRAIASSISAPAPAPRASWLPGASAGIDLFGEIDAALAGLARANADVNAIRADVIVLDVEADAAAFAAAGFVPTVSMWC